jgi:hypothetical protein
MMKTKGNIIFFCFILGFISNCAGCAHGPARHHTLGYYRYAGSEFTKRSSLPVIPIALITGLATDAVLIVADTVATPVAAWIVPGVVVKVSPDEETNNMANLLIPTYPLTLANIGAMGLGSGTKAEYEEIFGHESSLFQAGLSDGAAGEQESP